MITPYGEFDDAMFPDLEGAKAMMEPKTIQQLISREMLFFQWAGLAEGYEGPGRYTHAKSLCDALWNTDTGKKGWAPAFMWHPDLESALQEYCACGPVGEVILAGPASYSKTFGASLFACIFWMCSPAKTGVLGCSTTYRGLKERFWTEVRTLYNKAVPITGKLGRVVDSDIMIQTEKGDMRHGIFGLAVAQGEEQKAIDRIIGFHPRRILVVADELTGIPWAIIKALSNLFTAKQKALFIGLGNPSFIFDSHGKMCEPKDGWGSVTVDSDRWETKRGGVCLHFDGLKSPNIIAKKTVYPFLLTQEDIDRTAREYGYDSPEMWRMRRGFWCPEGTTKTVLNDSLIRKFQAMEKCVWEGATQRWASLDPAFEGGDRCVLRFGRTGKSDANVDTLEFEEMLIIKVSVISRDPIHYQIARRVREECIARSVDVRNFGMDVTGEGGGLASIIAEEWSPGFHQVEFGGKPSDLPVSEVNRKPCNKEYLDKVTELWFSFRTGVMLNQIRGLDADTALEFCSRLYTVDGVTWVESKREMKARPGARSPDLADNACIMWDTVKHRGGIGKGVSKVQASRNREWYELARKQELDDEDNFLGDPVSAVI